MPSHPTPLRSTRPSDISDLGAAAAGQELMPASLEGAGGVSTGMGDPFVRARPFE